LLIRQEFDALQQQLFLARITEHPHRGLTGKRDVLTVDLERCPIDDAIDHPREVFGAYRVQALFLALPFAAVDLRPFLLQRLALPPDVDAVVECDRLGMTGPSEGDTPPDRLARRRVTDFEFGGIERVEIGESSAPFAFASVITPRSSAA